MLNRLPADVRRTQLIEAGLTIAERSGIASVTVRAVAEQAHVSLGVVHYCFENKEALVAAMGEQLVTQLSGAMREALGAETTESAACLTGARGMRELLHRGLTAMWDIIENTADRQLLTYEITTYSLRSRAAGSTVAGNIGLLQYQVMDTEAAQFLARTAAFTSMAWTEPLSSLARAALATIDGLVLRWLVDRDSLAIIAELDDLAARFTTKAVPL
ncbi:TetR/AcrR family transcriptional regulator [Rhodococcoides trifolii]|nr:TetR family transcriptional regulator [Rhodococcus trifolii]